MVLRVVGTDDVLEGELGVLLGDEMDEDLDSEVVEAETDATEEVEISLSDKMD